MELRNDKCSYLKKIKTSYNYRLVSPEKNLVTREDCISFDPAYFLEFENSFKDDVLKATIGEAREGK